MEQLHLHRLKKESQALLRVLVWMLCAHKITTKGRSSNTSMLQEHMGPLL